MNGGLVPYTIAGNSITFTPTAEQCSIIVTADYTCSCTVSIGPVDPFWKCDIVDADKYPYNVRLGDRFTLTVDEDGCPLKDNSMVNG